MALANSRSFSSTRGPSVGLETRTRQRGAWSEPFLRWAGSKKKLLPELMGLEPAGYRRYVEPFAGSACLFFALRPKRALLGDLNAELIDTYQIVKRHPRRVSRTLQALPRTEAAYYRIRAWDPDHLEPINRAARFIYLNRNCFNGVYRVNRRGEFNVPRGRNTGELPTERLIYRCSVALRAARLCAGDFETCLASVRRDDFVYLDPPYASADRSTYGEYGYGSFANDDLERLIESLRRLDRIGAVFLLSYSDVPALRSVGDWPQKRVLTRRHVAGFACHRRRVFEMLVSNRDLVVDQ